MGSSRVYSSSARQASQSTRKMILSSTPRSSFCVDPYYFLEQVTTEMPSEIKGVTETKKLRTFSFIKKRRMNVFEQKERELEKAKQNHPVASQRDVKSARYINKSEIKRRYLSFIKNKVPKCVCQIKDHKIKNQRVTFGPEVRIQEIPPESTETKNDLKKTATDIPVSIECGDRTSANGRGPKNDSVVQDLIEKYKRFANEIDDDKKAGCVEFRCQNCNCVTKYQLLET